MSGDLNEYYSASWEIDKLENLCDLITDGSHFSPIPQEDGEIIVNVKDMSTWGIDFNSCTRISGKEFDFISKQNCAPKYNDVLLSKDGTIGRVLVYKDDRKVVLLSSIAILRTKDIIIPDFLSVIIRSIIFKKQLYKYESGSALKRLVLRDIQKLLIPFPKEKEQRKIARILSTVDAVIEKTEAAIAKYKAIKAGMMRDLFTRGIDLKTGKLRPRYEDAPELYKESELGWVPKDWEVKPLLKLAKDGMKNGYFKKPEYVGCGYKLINVTDLYQPFEIDINQKDVQRVFATTNDYSKYEVQVGDLFFTRSSLVLEGIAHCNIVLNLPEQAVWECHVVRLRPDKQKICPEFLGFYGTTHEARLFFMSIAKQVTMTTISQPDIAKLPVRFPINLDEQNEIAKRLRTVDVNIRNEEAVKSKYQQLKSGLMSDLLTGKVRVKYNETEKVEAK